MRESIVVICPTAQARTPAADWHDGQFVHGAYAALPVGHVDPSPRALASGEGYEEPRVTIKCSNTKRSVPTAITLAERMVGPGARAVALVRGRAFARPVGLAGTTTKLKQQPAPVPSRWNTHPDRRSQPRKCIARVNSSASTLNARVEPCDICVHAVRARASRLCCPDKRPLRSPDREKWSVQWGADHARHQADCPARFSVFDNLDPPPGHPPAVPPAGTSSGGGGPTADDGWQTHVIEFFAIGTAVLPLDQEIAPEKIADPIMVLSVND